VLRATLSDLSSKYIANKAQQEAAFLVPRESTCEVVIDKQILVSRYREHVDPESNYEDITVNVTWNHYFETYNRAWSSIHMKNIFLREIDSNFSFNSDIMIEEATTFNVSTDNSNNK
jgi:hypothetical protein